MGSRRRIVSVARVAVYVAAAGLLCGNQCVGKLTPTPGTEARSLSPTYSAWSVAVIDSILCLGNRAVEEELAAIAEKEYVIARGTAEGGGAEGIWHVDTYAPWTYEAECGDVGRGSDALLPNGFCGIHAVVPDTEPQRQYVCAATPSGGGMLAFANVNGANVGTFRQFPSAQRLDLRMECDGSNVQFFARDAASEGPFQMLATVPFTEGDGPVWPGALCNGLRRGGEVGFTDPHVETDEWDPNEVAELHEQSLGRYGIELAEAYGAANDSDCSGETCRLAITSSTTAATEILRGIREYGDGAYHDSIEDAGQRPNKKKSKKPLYAKLYKKALKRLKRSERFVKKAGKKAAKGKSRKGIRKLLGKSILSAQQYGELYYTALRSIGED